MNQKLQSALIVGLLSHFMVACVLSTGHESENEYLYRVPIQERWGYANANGQIVIPAVFEMAGTFNGGVASVGCGAKQALIDRRGTLLTGCEYDSIGGFVDGLAFVRRGNRYGYINHDAEVMWLPAGHEGRNFACGLALVYSEGLAGYMDVTLTWKIAPEFDWGAEFGECLANVSLRGDQYYIDPTGRRVLAGRGGMFHDGLAWREHDGKYGFVNKKGQYVIDPLFDSVSNFHEGRAAVSEDEEWFLINIEGEAVGPHVFDDVDYSGNELVAARIGEAWGFIDREGEWVITPRYTATRECGPELCLVEEDDEWILVDRQGRIVTLSED